MAKKSIRESVLRQASKLEPNELTLKTPLHVLLGEAVEVARFCQRYWKAEYAPKTGVLLRPGLELAGEQLLAPNLPDEILALVELVNEAQSDYLLAAEPPKNRDELERAKFVRSELSAALHWLFDDGVEDERDVQLARIVAEHQDGPDSEDALAAELHDYAALAERVRDEIDGLGAFDASLVDEARALVGALRERSAAGPSERATESGRLLERRNRLATLLQRKVARVRAAARFVFRHHPALIREVTSTYERRGRLARKRRRVEDSGPDEPAPPAQF